MRCTEAAPGQEDKLAAVHLPVATTRTPVGYTGEQTNPVAGLQHYYARDYQPGLASWIQADTWAGDVSQPGTLSKYGYVLNNSTTLTDVLGNRPCAYEYNNGCHDQPQPSFFAPTPVAWTPPMLAPSTDTSTDDPGGASETVDWAESGPSAPGMQAGPTQRSGWYRGAAAADCFLGDPGSVVDCLLYPITSQIENGTRDFQNQIAAIDAWVAQNLSAGVSFSLCFGLCGEIFASTSGFGVGFGIGPRIGGSFQFGVEAYGGSGWSQAGSCEASFGPVGVYGEFSKNSGGYAAGAGYAPGAELGCSVMIRHEWNWQ